MNESTTLLEAMPLLSQEKIEKSCGDNPKIGSQEVNKHTLPSKFFKEIKDAIQGWAGSKVTR